MRSARHLPVLLLAWVLLVLPALARAQDPDLPDRVARLSLVRGDVSVAPGGSDAWHAASLNRPLLQGDRLYTGDDARAVLEFGGGSLRIAERSVVHLVALDDTRTQIEVTQGTVNLGVERMDRDQTWEVDTPALAFVADRSGSYRIDIDPDGYGAMVTVFAGQGSVYGERDSARRVYSGRSYRFDNSDVDQASISSIPAYNDFDRFCADLDSRYADSTSSRYVADNVVGYSDLDRYGVWETSVEYGHVWYPTTVYAGWAPYRDGRWTWIDPWGWTWVDASPWGFAPFHYGRWAYVHNRWGWVPGPRLRRAVFAPALVAFVGNVSISVGGGAPVGWFPLGPRDIYQPPYRVTENYFININLGNGRFFHRNQMRDRWHDYHNHRNPHRFNYAYRHNPHAVTVVSREDFRNSRLVRRSNARMSEAVLRQSHVERAPAVQPGQLSAGAGPARVRPGHPGLARASASRSSAGRMVEGPTVERDAPRGAPQRSAVASVASPRSMPQTSRDIAQPATRSVPVHALRPAQVESRRAPRGLPAVRPVSRAPEPRGTLQSVAPAGGTMRPSATFERQPATSVSRSMPRAVPRATSRPQPLVRSQAASLAPSRPPVQARALPQVSHSRTSSMVPAPRSTPRASSGSSGSNSTHESAIPVRSTSPRGRPQHRASGGVR